MQLLCEDVRGLLKKYLVNKQVKENEGEQQAGQGER